MASVYLIELEINYKGVELSAFHKTWLDDVYFYLSKRKEGKVKHLWKAVAQRKKDKYSRYRLGQMFVKPSSGTPQRTRHYTYHIWKVVSQHKVFIVIEETASELDKLLFSTPLMKTMGDQVTVKVTSLLGYEAFTNNLNEMRGDATRHDVIEAPRKDGGVYYWLDFEIGYTGQSYDDFLRIWSEEAGFALKMAKPYGIALDLWKVVGERRVLVIAREESPAGLDKISFALPLMVQNGHNVELKVTSVVPFETLAQNLSSS